MMDESVERIGTSSIRRRLPSFVDDLYLATSGIEIGVFARRRAKIEAHFINAAASHDVSASHSAGAASVTSKPARRLPFLRKLAYGVGHVFNDMSSCMWFTYLIIFFQRVVKFNDISAGLLFLVGEIANAVTTSIIGFVCDNTRTRYGRRKTWHLVGTILAAVSLIFIWYDTCRPCRPSSMATPGEQALQIFYFVIPLCVYVFGFACMQISHLSLIPELTDDDSERVELSAIRYHILYYMLQHGLHSVLYNPWLIIAIHKAGGELACLPSM